MKTDGTIAPLPFRFAPSRDVLRDLFHQASARTIKRRDLPAKFNRPTTVAIKHGLLNKIKY